MQSKVQLVNDYKKTRKKTPKQEDQRPSEEEVKYQYTERILCPRDVKEINAMADRLWAYVQKPDTVNFEDFCADEGMSPYMLTHWSKRNKYFADIYKRSKLKIGARLDRGFLSKQYEYRCRISLYNYMDRAKDDDKREDDRAVERAIRTNKETINELAKANQLSKLKNLNLEIAVESSEKEK